MSKKYRVTAKGAIHRKPGFVGRRYRVRWFNQRTGKFFKPVIMAASADDARQQIQYLLNSMAASHNIQGQICGVDLVRKTPVRKTVRKRMASNDGISIVGGIRHIRHSYAK